MNWIFDIFKDVYGNEHPINPDNSRKFTDIFGDTEVIKDSPPSGTIQIPKLFVKSRISKDLKIEQRMIVFSFMTQLDNAIDIEEEPIF
jgi:hypothetical protein